MVRTDSSSERSAEEHRPFSRRTLTLRLVRSRPSLAGPLADTTHRLVFDNCARARKTEAAERSRFMRPEQSSSAPPCPRLLFAPRDPLVSADSPRRTNAVLSSSQRIPMRFPTAPYLNKSVGQDGEREGGRERRLGRDKRVTINKS